MTVIVTRTRFGGRRYCFQARYGMPWFCVDPWVRPSLLLSGNGYKYSLLTYLLT